MTIAILCPGQGSQKPGMLLSQGANLALVAQWGARAGVELVSLGTTADAATIAATEFAQPLIVATGLLSALTDHDIAERLNRQEKATLVAGHSLGAITAAAIAGIISYSDAVVIAAERGRLMAASKANGGMAAVIGSDLATVTVAAKNAGVAIATVNAPNQIVIAGPTDRLNAFSAPAKARMVQLPVTGPFHTAAYASASQKFASFLTAFDFQSPTIPLVCDLDGTIFDADTPPSVIKDYLVQQIVSPIRWDKVSATLASLGVSEVSELEPAGTLTRLTKRALPSNRSNIG